MGETTNIDVALLKDQVKVLARRTQTMEDRMELFFRQDWNKIDVLIAKQDALARTVGAQIAKDEAEHAHLNLSVSSLKTGLAVVGVLTSAALAASGVRLVWSILTGGPN